MKIKLSIEQWKWNIPVTTPGLTVCMFGVFSKVLTQPFCGVLPSPPKGAIGAMPGVICKKDEMSAATFGWKEWWFYVKKKRDKMDKTPTIGNISTYDKNNGNKKHEKENSLTREWEIPLIGSSSGSARESELLLLRWMFGIGLTTATWEWGQCNAENDGGGWW